MILIENPESYRGEYGNKGSDEQTIHDRNYFVNGLLNITSSALMSGFFVSEIANSGIVVGPFPLFEIDVD